MIKESLSGVKTGHKLISNAWPSWEEIKRRDMVMNHECEWHAHLLAVVVRAWPCVQEGPSSWEAAPLQPAGPEGVQAFATCPAPVQAACECDTCECDQAVMTDACGSAAETGSVVEG